MLRALCLIHPPEGVAGSSELRKGIMYDTDTFVEAAIRTVRSAVQ